MSGPRWLADGVCTAKQPSLELVASRLLLFHTPCLCLTTLSVQVFSKVDYNKNGLIEPLEVEVAILSLCVRSASAWGLHCASLSVLLPVYLCQQHCVCVPTTQATASSLRVVAVVVCRYNVINKRLPGWQDPPTRDAIQVSRTGCMQTSRSMKDQVLQPRSTLASCCDQLRQLAASFGLNYPKRTHCRRCSCCVLLFGASDNTQVALKAFDDDHNGALDQGEFERFAKSLMKSGRRG